MNFFEKNDLEELLKCKLCKQKLTEYDEPKLMPCNQTICSSCDSKIELNLNDKIKRSFKCELCLTDKEHVKPCEGFPINQLVLQLFALKPKKMFRNEKAKILDTNLSSLNELITKIDFDSNNNDYILNAHCSELRQRIQLATEERIEQLNKQNDLLIKQIDNYEKECKEAFRKNHKTNETLSEAKNFVEKQKINLNDLDDENRIKEANERVLQYISKLKIEKKKSSSLIFNQIFVEFVVNKTKLDPNLIGVVNLKELKPKEVTYKCI